ncbi:ABC transporter ATP-binding protein [Paenibacillus alkalitolerans]|uniref:ABC transporter ATP-binding protein n=1 Tax=Paenibacillus alkalitolerans TaxID=2799335 RepID=UPI0018F3B542|nr:ABC transporter ATP-binding protein [Paenibacillus alkalitolerans]
MLIKATNVWRTYGLGETAVHALRGIVLTVSQGEFIALLGHSGSGKSSLLHLLGAMDVPTRGEVIFKGEDIGKMNQRQLADLRLRCIGFIFQTFNLIPSLNALENVEIPMKLAGMKRKAAKEKAEYLLEQVHLADRSKHLPSQLSGGQRQRVAIARALANDPDLILADEPTGNLDSENGDLIVDLLLKLHQGGRTIVMVTHNPELTRDVSRIVYMRDGQLLAKAG